MDTDQPLIDLSRILPTPLHCLTAAIERMLSIRALNASHHRICRSESGGNFFETVLNELDIDAVVTDTDLAKIPRKGPLVVVANHPFGGVDGVILGAVLHSVREDVRILGNELLQRLPGLQDRVIPVDVLSGPAAARKNIQGMKSAISWVKAGGTLICFPAGEVSHLHAVSRSVTDPGWSSHVAAIIRHGRATTLPVYFPGRNSWLFQFAGLLHPRVRTLLLPREVMNKRGRSVTVRIGKASPWKKLASAPSDGDRIRFLREKTYFLRNRDCTGSGICFPQFPKPAEQPPKAQLAPPVDPAVLCREIRALPPEAHLADAKDLTVVVSTADRIPHCLEEIGRLRELTFRGVGEGTGRAMDVDVFDGHYRHLILWNDRAGEIAGAYRMGLTDEILLSRGEQGLYTSTLFRYREGFLDGIGPAIELGRSFIRPEYQRRANSLALMWKGIAAFIVRNPRYARLFGPVSISQDYERLSRDLIVMYLRQKKMDENLSRLVTARTPARPRRIRPIRSRSLRHPLYDAEEISLLVSEIESDGKGLPVLLKHYLKLDAVLLSFNLDRSFANVVDGLILLDLTRTESKTVRRFLGEDGYRRFMDYHTEITAADCRYRRTA